MDTNYTEEELQAIKELEEAGIMVPGKEIQISVYFGLTDKKYGHSHRWVHFDTSVELVPIGLYEKEDSILSFPYDLVCKLWAKFGRTVLDMKTNA